MSNALIETLVLGTVFFLLLAFVFRPRSISLRILRILQDGPRTLDDLTKTLELPADKVATANTPFVGCRQMLV